MQTWSTVGCSKANVGIGIKAALDSTSITWVQLAGMRDIYCQWYFLSGLFILRSNHVRTWVDVGNVGLGDGRYEHTLHIKPICYADGSIINVLIQLGRLVELDFDHIWFWSPNWWYPIRWWDIRFIHWESKTGILSLAAPYIRVGGQWVRPGFWW